MKEKINNGEVTEEIVNTKATQAPAVRETIALSEVQELDTVTVKGGFRGYWVNCPETEVNGEKRPARLQFKFSRRVKLSDGRVVKQTAWVTEQDAQAWGFVPGVKYTMEFEAGEEMVGDRKNGTTEYLDEYALYDATIVSANGQTTPPLTK